MSGIYNVLDTNLLPTSEHTRAESMRAYDRLPAVIRRAIRECPYEFCVVDELAYWRDYRRWGYTAREFAEQFAVKTTALVPRLAKEAYGKTHPSARRRHK